MKRREFIKKSFHSGIATGTLYSFGMFNNLFSSTKYSTVEPNYDLVAIKGGEPEVMFDKAIESMGGMSKFVKKGQRVVVKPNMGWDVIPERAANTNPKLIAQIVKHCYNAGAKEVLVFDNACDNWIKSYKNSEIEKYAKDAGAKVVPANSESYYQQVEVKNGTKLKEVKVHELILEADVFINVPVLKNHSSARLTIAMKNLMGIIWDRRYWHSTDLHQCIADFCTFKKPDLNIVDAYNVMRKNGPRGVSVDDVLTMKNLLISKDIVAIDSAATKIFGFEPKDIGYIRIASENKIGTMDLEKLNIKKISL